MKDDINITLFPAKEGDCLLITYGSDSEKKYMLIDGGRSWTYKNALKQYLTDNNISELELFVTTHIDRDHIDGVTEMLEDEDMTVNIKEIWFNTWDHLNGETIETEDQDEDIESFGAKMGETLSGLILKKGWKWNSRFAGNAVEIKQDIDANRIQIGDVTLTLLSPDREKLKALIPDWKKECEKAGLVPGYSVEDYTIEDEDIEAFGTIDIDELAEEEFEDDQSDANGASIAFLLEYKGRRLLLSGDAHVDMLVNGLNKLGATEDKPLRIDAFKLPHHGSKHNISKELLRLIQCDNYLVSTNGNYFKHPDEVAMSRIIKFGTENATIRFNYISDYSKIWDNEHWKEDYKYDTTYPSQNENGFLKLTLPIGQE